MDHSLNDFLARNRISSEAWDKSGCDWDALRHIALDHEQQESHLVKSANLYANLIQAISGVHSVRWRVKSPEHLLEKIVRKKAEQEAKYADISVDNYFEIVTDLVGIRALHLFKDDWISIHLALVAELNMAENPVAYLRNGDPEELSSKYSEYGLDVRHHPAGYRSVHYVISAQPMKRRVVAEIQTRTIFEEGWSEIDHKIRYPNFSDNQLVAYFLTIFNRLAGSSDEMGSFVRGLASSLEALQQQIVDASAERDASISKMESLVAKLEATEKKNQKSEVTISELRAEMTRFKKDASSDPWKSSSPAGAELYKALTESPADKALREISFAKKSMAALDPYATHPSTLAQLEKILGKKR